MNRAIDKGLAQCSVCRTLTDQPGEDCQVCGNRTQIRDPHCLQKVWAFWCAGLLAFIPGNLLPIMVTRSVNGDSASTIIGGVVTLMHHGSYAIAIVVFVASVVVPVGKFITIAWLALSIQFQWQVSEHQRHIAYELIELVGRWSMIDVFVVAALAALIQVGGLMSIVPGVGINAFAFSVVFTMLAAISFDPRQIWDHPSARSTSGTQGVADVQD
ncbi:MAG: paraquat-inducible protein A [Pseudomonadota bacterium]